MHIVVAPDKFKGSLSAAKVCDGIAAGWRTVDADSTLDLCPVADGGEGIVLALVGATGGRFVTRRVTGPLPEMKVDATFGILGDGKTAVIEMAAASGLALIPVDQRNPAATTTFGTGELMAAAAEMGAEKIIVGLGGSATMDGGIGAAQACGLPVLLADGEPSAETDPLTGADVEKVVFIKHGRGGKVDRAKIEAACDVTNPLCGPSGAAAVFGPQKGATAEQIGWFDRMLRRLAERNGKTSVAEMPGAGAAGGMGFGLAAFFGATLRPGFELVASAVRLEDRLRSADLCITGEGRLDGQSISGKAAIGVARICRRMNVPCIAIVGSAGDGVERTRAEGIDEYFAISDGGVGVEHSMSRAAELLKATAVKAARAYARRGGTA
ncbi:MAG TPA: glycerate kinase [Tepidisphaeraceae bacterium]|nr:glycerate kinase [Tepidisphaeraceae bacterium]